jgi:hypothetical protein
VCKTCIYVKISINIVDKFTILLFYTKLWQLNCCTRSVFIFIVQISFFLLLGCFCIAVFEDVRNIQMVSVAVCQINILD